MCQITIPKVGDCSIRNAAHTWISVWILFLDILIYAVVLNYFSPFTPPEASKPKASILLMRKKTDNSHGIDEKKIKTTNPRVHWLQKYHAQLSLPGYQA